MDENTYQLQNKVWNREVRDHRRALIPKRREGNEWEVRERDRKSVGDSKLYVTGLAGLEPLRAALGPRQTAQLASQSHVIGPDT